MTFTIDVQNNEKAFRRAVATALGAVAGAMVGSNNLSEVASDPVARVNLNIDQMTLVGNAAYVILSTDRSVATNAAFTLPRIWTLPAASALNAGQHLIVADKQGTLTTTNTLTLARAGADTINGATSLVLSTAYSDVDLISDGVSKWTAAVATPAIVRSNPYYDAVNDGGIDNTGATDVTSAVAALYAAGRDALAFPLGTYKTSGASGITVPTTCKLKGAGRAQSIITTTSSTGNTVTLANNGNQMHIEGFTLTRSVVPSAGAGLAFGSTNGVGQSTARDLYSTANFRGFSFGPTDYSTCQNLWADQCYDDAFRFNGVAGASCQMQYALDNCVANFCDGYGFHVVAPNGTLNLVLGCAWKDLRAFANKLGGFYFEAQGTGVINDSELVACIASSNNGSGIKYLCNTGLTHKITGGLYEQSGGQGVAGVGRAAGTAPSNAGAGIDISGVMHDLTIGGAVFSENAQDGIVFNAGAGASYVTIHGCIFKFNGKAAAGTTYRGISIGSAANVSVGNNICNDNGNHLAFLQAGAGSTVIVMGNFVNGCAGFTGAGALMPASAGNVYNTGTGMP